MRSPKDMDIVQVDISTKCHLKCSNCTRLIPHQPRREDMELETFERAVKSMDGWDGPNRVIGIIAGEPTLHSNFEKISRRFAELWGGPLTGNGRLPIKDFNHLATERLFDRSTGRGLWTSLGAGFYRHYETIMEVYGHWNTNTHESGGRHQALLISRDDYKAATGLSDEQWLQNRDNCWVQNMWSASINDKGAYFCEVAASIDRLYFNGAHAWPVEQGWWQRSPADFGAQLDLCNYCGLAQPGPAQLDLLERDIISKQNRDKLAEAGSPAVKKGNYELFDPALHMEKREVKTRDNYVGDERRVGIGNRTTRPHKLSCVVVSVNYGERLAETLPGNIGLFDQLVVVTSPEDALSQKVATDCGATLVVSSRCFDDDHSFNKGRMLNEGLAALKEPDWIILTDADVTLNPDTREHVFAHSFNPGCLYFTARQDHSPVAGQPVGVNMEPNGYFQMFNHRALAIRERWPRPVCEEFCSAGSVDSWFWQQWPREKIIFVPELAVQHFASARLGENWNGMDKMASGKWCQLGILTNQGFSSFQEIDHLPDMLKLTDTKYGQSKVIESKDINSYVRVVPGGLEFLGKPLEWCHIHVAYRS
ncbi:MAG TPA: hypothetical protein VHV26_11490 [Rhizomicrobium sp.]|jgi:hypothetical protein|nr:hypothetical protein [Rhizomicrobium sp.]